MRSWLSLKIIAVGFSGFIVGGLIFSDVQPRSLLAIRECRETCLQAKDIAGLMTSVGIQKVPEVIPGKVMETDKTIAIKHPFPEAPTHYLVIPKRDIRNAGELSEEDGSYLVDAYAVMGELIRRDHLTNYRIVTNGPVAQSTTYLHFHLLAH